MIIKDNMANMCAKVTSTYIEFTLAFGPKPEFSFSFKLTSFFYKSLNEKVNSTFGDADKILDQLRVRRFICILTKTASVL